MKRWLIAGAIFVGTMFVLLVLNVLIVSVIYMLRKPTEQASGPIALVVSPMSLFVLLILVVAFAVWLSGKLVRRASQKRS